MEVYIKSIPHWTQDDIVLYIPQRIISIQRIPNAFGEYMFYHPIYKGPVGLDRENFIPLSLYNIPLYQTLMEIDCEA